MHSTTRAASLALLAVVGLLALPPACVGAAANGALQGGDLLVSSFYNPAGVFVVRQQAVVQTLSAPPSTSNQEVRGASPTPSGKIVSTWDIYLRGGSGLYVFDPRTAAVTSIPTPDVVLPGDVSVMANGNYVVSDQWGRDIDVYSPSGVHLQQMTAPFPDSPTGNTVAPDGSIWVTVARSQDIFHFSPTGALLGSFRPGFNPGDIIVDPVDGTLWFPNIDSNTVHQFTPAGQPLSSFTTLFSPANQQFMGIAMSPSRQLYLSHGITSGLLLYDRQGNHQASFNVGGADLITYISAVIPEPSSAALLATAFAAIAARRRHRNRWPANSSSIFNRSDELPPRSPRAGSPAT